MIGKVWKKTYLVNSHLKKKARVTTLWSYKVDLRANKIISNFSKTEILYNNKGIDPPEDMAILNVYTSNDRASKHKKQKLIKIKAAITG